MIAPERVPGLIADLAPYVAVACEAQVIDWSNRAQYGPWLKIRVEDGSLLKGMEQGQRYHVVLVKILEDEMPAAAEGKERRPFKQSQVAGMLCNDKQFQAFIRDAYGEAINDVTEAAQWVRESCGINSRAELDSNPEAAETFKRITDEYDSWKRKGEPA